MPGVDLRKTSSKCLVRERSTVSSHETPKAPPLAPSFTAQEHCERALLALRNPEEREPQRRRGVSFRDEYRALKGTNGRIRAPSMIHEPTKDMIPPQRRDDRHKITVVLDLDETLIYAREGPLYARPHLDVLLSFLNDHCETVVWTAGVKAYAQLIVKTIDPKGVIKHCIYRHKRWFTGKAGYQKDLTMLGRDMDKIIIIENTPDCVRGNPFNGILVRDYEGGEAGDPTIPALTHLLASLVDSGLSVPDFIRTSNMLTRTEMETDLGDMFPVYTLNCSTVAIKTNTRINRDLHPSQVNVEAPEIGGIPLHVPISPGGSSHPEWGQVS